MSDTAAPAPMPPLPCSELERIIDIVRGAVDKPLPKPGEFSLLWNTIAAWKTRPAPTPCKMRVIAGHECIEGTCTMRSASDGEYDCGNTRPAPAPQAEQPEAETPYERHEREKYEAIDRRDALRKQAEQPDVDALIKALRNNHNIGIQDQAADTIEALRAAFAARDAEIVKGAKDHLAEVRELEAERRKLIDDLSYANLTMTGIEDRAKAAEAREAALLAALKPIVADDEPTVSLADQRKRWVENMDRARTTLANLPALSRGDMVMVPRVPTPEMLGRGIASAYDSSPADFHDLEREAILSMVLPTYTAMLAAAQEKQG